MLHDADAVPGLNVSVVIDTLTAVLVHVPLDHGFWCGQVHICLVVAT